MNKTYRLEQLTEQLIETYKAKNKDYGDSFADSFREFGITSAVVRMNDKMNRIKSLSKSEDRQVKDESLRDSLMDLANYALMTVIELENEQMRGVKGEPGIHVNSGTFDINKFKENLESGFTITHNGRPLRAMFEELGYSDDEHDCINKDIEDSKTRYWLKYKGGVDIHLEKFDIIDGFVEFKDCEDRWEMTFDEVCEAIEKYKLNIDNFELMKVKKENVGTIGRPDTFEKAIRDCEIGSDYEVGRQENL